MEKIKKFFKGNIPENNIMMFKFIIWSLVFKTIATMRNFLESIVRKKYEIWSTKSSQSKLQLMRILGCIIRTKVNYYRSTAKKFSTAGDTIFHIEQFHLQFNDKWKKKKRYSPFFQFEI